MTPFRWPWLAVVVFGLYATRTYATRTECQRGAAAFYRVGFRPEWAPPDDPPVIWTLLAILLGVAVGSLLVVLVILPRKRARRRRWARRG